MVSRAGEAAISAVSLVDAVNILITQVFTALATGGTIICAQYIGRQDKKESIRAARQVVWTVFVISMAISIICVAFRRPLLALIFGKVEKAVMTNSITYMWITACSFPFIALFQAGAAFFQASGDSRFPMTVSVISNIINIVGNAILIFGFHMGVAGAAWATVIAQFASCSFAFCFLIGKKVPVRITRLKKEMLSKNITCRILGLGLSPFLILATDSVIIIIMNTVLQHYGGPKEGDLLITCATIVQSYMMLITGPMLGISSGTQAILSYNYGAKATRRVRKAERYILLLCLCFTSLMFLLSRIVPQYFIGIFTRDPGLTDLCIWGIHIFTLMIVPLSFQYVFVDGFTALGRSKTALFLSLFRKGDYVLFTMILPIFYGARSAFYAQPLADGIAAVMSTVAFLLIFKKHLQKQEVSL